MYMLDDQNKMSKNHKVFLQQSNKSNQSNKSLENFL